MIRGAIDYLDSNNVSGWVHSDEVKVAGRTLLAFIDRVCVGAGLIGAFRQDLVDAGVGDGHVGFNFTISPYDLASVERLEVRFEGSDFTLLSPSFGRGRSDSLKKIAAAPLFRPERIRWMRERGWISQIEFDFLKQISNMGYYERSLRQEGGGMNDPAGEAEALLSLVAQESIHLSSREVSLAGLADERTEILDETAWPVVALCSHAGSVRVLEGSHLQPDGERADPSLLGIRAPLSHSTLLLLDLNASFTASGASATLFLTTQRS